jgi:hypothetical protein
MDDKEHTPAATSSAEYKALPPVTPPTAGFIVQLFVIPAVVVAIVVLVWLLFNWLVHMGSNPAEYLKTIRQGRLDAWQAAHDLATELSGNEELRQDASLASETSALFVEHLNQPRPETSREREGYDNLAFFLCAALGQFSRPEAVPGLIQAAQTDWPEEPGVRLRAGALESLSILVNSCRTAGVELPTERILPALVELSHDPDDRVRKRAAYALAVAGGDEASARLRFLLGDAVADVRYNAATGLSRQANPEAVNVEVADVLKEMLDPQAPVPVPANASGGDRDALRVLLLRNGLRAASALARNNPQMPREDLRQAVLELRQAIDNGEVPSGAQVSLAIESKAALRELESPE